MLTWDEEERGKRSKRKKEKERERERERARYGGIKVGWKKIQRNIGHFLVLVEYISIAVSYKRKKFTVQFFNN